MVIVSDEECYYVSVLPKKVIMLTGHGSEQAAFDYLTKPYELDELNGKIRQTAAKGGGDTSGCV